MRRNHVVRAVALTLLTGLALMLGSAPAWAHSRLESSNPKAGASMATAPQQVSLTFNEPVQPGFTTITVVGPDGDDYHSGQPTEVDDTVTMGLLPLGPAGAYRIGYRVVSADGHPIAGSIPFTLTTAGPGAAAAAPTSGAAAPTSGAGAPTNAAPATAAPVAVPVAAADSTGGGAPVWPWIVGAVVVVAIGVTAALRLGRA